MRQYVAVKFRPTDRQPYTYHNDGDPVAVNREVKVPDRSGDGWNRAIVVGIVDKPKFDTKAILGLAPATDALPADPPKTRTPMPADDLFGGLPKLDW